MKKVDVKVHWVSSAKTRLDLECNSLEKFLDLPNAVMFDNVKYYKGSYHRANKRAMYAADPAVESVYEVEEDVTDHPLYKPQVLIGDANTQDSKWVTLDDFLEKLSQNVYVATHDQYHHREDLAKQNEEMDKVALEDLLKN